MEQANPKTLALKAKDDVRIAVWRWRQIPQVFPQACETDYLPTST